ncbi:hypothetical protein VKT23_020085 [Stygiomarasmius scandens]|uniref:Uncharacterized protein n=1 Tax=Marasmiellus scandens TaxID=2682957 RepID=A0ABR1IK34_9AGAR
MPTRRQSQGSTFHYGTAYQRQLPKRSKYKRSLTEDTGLSLVKKPNATFTVKLIDTVKASPNARPDEALTWQEILCAKTVFITNLHIGDYPKEHVKMFSQFYVNMELCLALHKE